MAETSGSTAGKPPLEIETNYVTDADLTDMCAFEGLNQSIVINRSVQWYAICQRVIRNGGQVLLRQPGSDEIVPIELE